MKTRLLAALLLSSALAGAAAASPIMGEPTTVDPGTYTVTTIAEGLDHPWSLAFLPDGSILVTERNNGLRLIRDGKLVAEPIAGLPEAFKQGQGGYFDIALDRNFTSNNFVYLSYAEGTEAANHTAIARGRFDGKALQDVTVIFRNTPDKDTDAHFGGRLVVLPDNTLLLTTGDGFEYREKAQDKSSGLGKIIRIMGDGTVPTDNPFTADSTAMPTIYSYGHRNQQGLALDPATGAVWQTEHGALSGDEVNFIKPGENYGWPIATYSIDYSGSVISPYTEKEGTTQPVAVWKPERFAPSGLAVYRGTLFPGWDGALLAGSLAEGCVDLIMIDAGGAMTKHERLFAELKHRIRDVRVAPDGAIYLLTDQNDGQVLRVTPK